MIKLLVVDDESATRKGIIKYVNWSELGVHLVEEAKDGIEGLEIAREFHPNIVISDIKMPGMNGIEFATNLRALFPETRLIFLSGYSDKEYLKAAIHLSAVSYVEKPLDLGELKDVIKKAVTLYIEDQNKKTALSEGLPLIRKNIVFKLIGRKTLPEELLKDLQIVNVPFKVDGLFTVIIIKANFNPDTDPNVIINKIGNCLYDIIHICAEKNGSYVIIVSDINSIGRNKRISTILEKLGTHIKEYSSANIDLFCAVGAPVKGMVQIHESYETACLALQKVFFQGYGKIVFYENEALRFISFDQDITANFLELIQDEKKDEVIGFIEKLCREICVNQGTLVDKVKSVFFKLSLVLFREAEKRGLQLNNYSGSEEKNIWELISNFETLEDIKGYVIGNIIMFFEGIKSLESFSRSILKAMDYIRRNYFAPDLSVKLLSEHIYLTPTYLSSLFKKETGMTISEYIIKVRIDKSKELLLDPQIKLFEVAKKVGYNDANYYSKAFSKQTGMTPSTFREKYII